MQASTRTLRDVLQKTLLGYGKNCEILKLPKSESFLVEGSETNVASRLVICAELKKRHITETGDCKLCG
jgi:hypothetical protein